jgi:hypothetical protein
MGKHWTTRRVVAHTNRTVIDKWILQEHGHKPGDTQYLGVYQNALSVAVESLSMEDQIKFQQIANRWNQNGPPPEVKKL